MLVNIERNKICVKLRKNNDRNREYAKKLSTIFEMKRIELI